MMCGIVLVCEIGRNGDTNDQADKKEKNKAGETVDKAADESGSDKEIVKEWRTRSRALEKGNLVLTCIVK